MACNNPIFPYILGSIPFSSKTFKENKAKRAVKMESKKFEKPWTESIVDKLTHMQWISKVGVGACISVSTTNGVEKASVRNTQDVETIEAGTTKGDPIFDPARFKKQNPHDWLYAFNAMRHNFTSHDPFFRTLLIIGDMNCTLFGWVLGNWIIGYRVKSQ